MERELVSYIDHEDGIELSPASLLEKQRARHCIIVKH